MGRGIERRGGCVAAGAGGGDDADEKLDEAAGFDCVGSAGEGFGSGLQGVEAGLGGGTVEALGVELIVFFESGVDGWGIEERRGFEHGYVGVLGETVDVISGVLIGVEEGALRRGEVGEVVRGLSLE